MMVANAFAAGWVFWKRAHTSSVMQYPYHFQLLQRDTKLFIHSRDHVYTEDNI